MGEAGAAATYTRAEVAAHAGVSPNVVQHWERQGLLHPSVRAARRGQTQPNLYSPADLAVGAFLAHARQLGLARPALAPAAAALASDPRLVAGFRGWVVVDVEGQVRVNDDLALLVELLEVRRTAAVLLAPIEVPQPHREELARAG